MKVTNSISLTVAALVVCSLLASCDILWESQIVNRSSARVKVIGCKGDYYTQIREVYFVRPSDSTFRDTVYNGCQARVGELGPNDTFVIATRIGGIDTAHMLFTSLGFYTPTRTLHFPTMQQFLDSSELGSYRYTYTIR